MRIVCAALITGLIAVLAGCSTLSPQIFSDRLLESKPEPTTPIRTVTDANKEVEKVVRRYVSAVSNLSAVKTRVSAALIGLSGFALFKALIGGSTDDIAGAGVAGSVLWAYGTTMTSTPRQRVYLEGARSLSCAALATEPYDKDAAWVKDLEEKSEAAALSLQELRNWRDTHAVLLLPEVTRETPSRPAGCGPRPPCSEVAADTTADAVDLANDCKTLHSNWDAQCAPPQPRTITRTAAPEIANGFDRVDEEMNRLERVLVRADELAGRLEMAGRKLWRQAVRIQLQVSAEVLKTEPDPTAVLATVKNLRQVAGTIGASDFALPAGQAQAGESDTTRPRALDDGQRAVLTTLPALLSRSFAARVALERMLAHIDGTVAATNQELEPCGFTAQELARATQPATGDTQAVTRGSGASSGGRVTRLEDLGPTDLANLGLSTTSTVAERAAAVRRCQEKLGKPSPPTGEYDEQTRAAAQRGACRS